MLVDFHTHILPSIDDGAKNTEISIKMINELISQGIEKIVLTPHFYSNEISINDFVKKREKSYNDLISNSNIKKENLILASETYFTDYIFNNKDISDLYIGKTNYIMLELPYSESISNRFIEKIKKLIYTYNVIPMIAHVERYPDVINNTKIYRKLLDLGCLFQMNLSSLNNNFFKKRKLLKLIKFEYIHVLGTDCHNLTTRPPIYKEYADLIIENLGNDPFNTICNNAEKIINC